MQNYSWNIYCCIKYFLLIVFASFKTFIQTIDEGVLMDDHLQRKDSRFEQYISTCDRTWMMSSVFVITKSQNLQLSWSCRRKFDHHLTWLAVLFDEQELRGFPLNASCYCVLKDQLVFLARWKHCWWNKGKTLDQDVLQGWLSQVFPPFQAAFFKKKKYISSRKKLAVFWVWVCSSKEPKTNPWL